MAPIFTLEENDWSDTETPFVDVKQQERSTNLVQVKPEPPQIKEEHQERSPSLVQVKPEPPQIKEEPKEELLQRPEEAAGSLLTSLAVKGEDDDGNRETEPLASTSTEHMKTQADVEHCGTSQPTGEDQLLSSNRSESDAEDSDEWDPSVLDRLKRGKKSFASTKCGQVSGSMGDLKKHMRTHTGEFVCSVCNKRFNQTQDVINHMRFHKEQRSFACSVCNKSLCNGQSVRQHMLLHTGKKPFSCSVCRENFQYKYQLIKHMDTHTGGKPCDSSVSSKRFTQSLNLETHTTGSSLTSPAVISEDDDGNRETEPLASTSTEHMKTQADVEHCGTSQPTVEVELLSSHGSESDAEDSDEVTSEDSDEWVPSEDSDEGVPSEDSYEWVPSVLNRLKSQKTQRVKGQRLSQNTKSPKQTPSLSVVPRRASIGVSNLSGSPYTRPAPKIFQPTHASFAGRPHTLIKLTRSETGEKSFSCTVCGKVSDSKGNLINHMKTHTGEKTFSCSVCDKSFGYKCVLINHMRTHTGEKPFACSVCDKSFNVAHHLNSHMRTHTGDKPFACSVCNKRFGQSANLKSHMTAHVDEMPFACSVCNDSFKRSGSLAKHMMIHTGEKPFVCSICKRCFRQSREMKTHMRTHTGERPFVCSVCNKSFIRSDLLVKHKRSHTGVMALSSSVQSEDDDGNRETEPLASTSHMTTRAGMRLKTKIN